MATTAELAAQLARLQHQLDHATRPPAFDEAEQIAAAQTRADGLLQRLGSPTPQPGPNESAERYRQRLLARLQPHSTLAGAVLPIGTMTGVVLENIEDKIYADAQAAARNPASHRPGVLTPIVRTDATGRRITEYVGDASVWRNAFTAPGIGVVMLK